MEKSKKGFTLIELLIVVAIIAILAAIAVPNFLEAQVRSKVSRQKANMRTVATALESYVVDFNRYPPCTYTGVYGWTGNDTTCWKVMPGRMTTPVSYITGDDALIDIFRTGHTFTTKVAYQIMYLPSFYYQPPYPGPATSFGAQVRTYGQWILRSAGPDKYYQNNLGDNYDYGGPGGARWNRASYDPTNGTVSTGDINRSQNKADQAHSGAQAI